MSRRRAMSAPTIKEDWKAALGELHVDWDSYGSPPTTQKAMATVEEFATVPTSAGGIQLEIHRDGYDIEIEIGPDGRIVGALVAHDT